MIHREARSNVAAAVAAPTAVFTNVLPAPPPLEHTRLVAPPIPFLITPPITLPAAAPSAVPAPSVLAPPTAAPPTVVAPSAAVPAAEDPLHRTDFPTPRIVPPTPLRMPPAFEITPAVAGAGLDPIAIDVKASATRVLADRRIPRPWKLELRAQIPERLVR